MRFIHVLLGMIAILAAAGCAGSNASDASLRGQIRRLSDSRAWSVAAFGLFNVMGTGDEMDAETEKRVEAIAAHVKEAGQARLDEARACAAKGSVEMRCWAIDILGRTQDPVSIDVLQRAAASKEWPLRASALLALGRIGTRHPSKVILDSLSKALHDQEKIDIMRTPRVPGQGGGAKEAYPVVLASLKAISMISGPDAVPLALEGLRTKPFASISYDSTPEPFPDTITKSLPGWYVAEASRTVLDAGEKAIPFLLEGMKQPDVDFSETSGGQHPMAAKGPGFLKAPAESLRVQATSYHAFIISHIEKIAGKEKAAELLKGAKKAGAPGP